MLLAFHNNHGIKSKYCRRLAQHHKADNLVRGSYWTAYENGRNKGCAVGCTLEKDGGDLGNHKQYEVQLGIPEEVAYLEDTIFECLPTREAAAKFAVDFLKVIPIGANLATVASRFKEWAGFPDRESARVAAFAGEAQLHHYSEARQTFWTRAAAELLRLLKSAPVPHKTAAANQA